MLICQVPAKKQKIVDEDSDTQSDSDIESITDIQGVSGSETDHSECDSDDDLDVSQSSVITDDANSQTQIQKMNQMMIENNSTDD